MRRKITFLLCLILFLVNGCVISSSYRGIKNPPAESFVKIFHSIKVSSCKDPNDVKCPVGEFFSMGSGMAINLIRDEMLVLTAGHVCDAKPTEAVKDFVQKTKVVDHTGTSHDSWVVLSEFTNGEGQPDMCILWVPTLSVDKINFSYKKPKVGQELYYIGAPMGVFHPPTVPIFRGIYSGPINASSSIITAPAAGGSSGSAVLNHENKIVGIIWGVKPGFHHVSLMTRYEASLSFLRRAASQFQRK
mgnify:CR=1 FL=1